MESNLMESKVEHNDSGGAAAVIPRPRTMGSCAISVAVLALLGGELRNELALTLLGTVFFIILIYSYLGVFFMGVICRGKSRSLSMFLSAETVVVGETAELCVKAGGLPPGKNYFLRLPVILVRCEFLLTTKDSRVIRHYIDPGVENSGSFRVCERGVYYGCRDSLVIFDAMGFFTLSLPLQQNDNPRLYAAPAPAEETIPLSLQSSGTEKINETNIRKSSELTDQRPYIPGDDPRRINWKLYSHAPLGELFVREGEGMPPPDSRLLILIDGEADDSLYTLDEARRAVDLLCENALAAALEFSGRGMEVLIGWTGGKVLGADEPLGASALSDEEFAVALAWPAAAGQPMAELPAAPESTAVLILALPRMSANTSALDRFLEKHGHESAPPADIVFLYDAKSRRAAELESAAGNCVSRYNGKNAIHAGKAAVNSRPDGEEKS